jgi:polyisoprenyl-phosphate glycosyltransferase
MNKLSIVIPCFNEASSLVKLHERVNVLCAAVKTQYNLPTEVIYIDDGSRDNTLEIVNSLSSNVADIQILSFSRNFGKEAALLAGLEASTGAVLFMDGDGQHPPELALQLVEHWIRGGYDVAYTYKRHRKGESATKSLFVKAFYGILNMGSRQKIPNDAGDFRLLSTRAVTALKQLPERNRFFKGLSAWIGFKQIGVAYDPAKRIDGETKWSFWNLLALSMEGITSFSVAPLRLAALTGAGLATFALFYAMIIIIQTIVSGKDVPGYPSIMFAVTLIGGIQLLMIGIMGEYIGKILNELKQRPSYIIASAEFKKVIE